MLLNFPLPNNGVLDAEEMKVLADIMQWMKVNGEGIYNSRPWKIYGDGPATKVPPSAARFNENAKPDLTSDDVRLTTVKEQLYVFMMGWNPGSVLIQALGEESPHSPGKIVDVSLLGRDAKLAWRQESQGLRITMPAKPISEIAVTLRVITA